MTAGRGIIHSEMPQQDRGRMRGFQLWINLPAKDKMKPASYRDLEAGDIPEVKLGEGKVRVIAGSYAGKNAAVKPARRTRPTSTCTCRPARRSASR